MSIVRDNPPRTLAAALAAVIPPLVVAADQLLATLPASTRPAVTALVYALTVAVAERVGKWTQRHTEPRGVVEELLGLTARAEEQASPRLDPDLPPVPEG